MPVEQFNKANSDIVVKALNLDFECPVKGTHLSQSMYLQQCIKDELDAEGKDGYIIPKTVERVSYYMTNHFVYCIFRKSATSFTDEAKEVETLIAQVTVYIPRGNEEFKSDIEGFEKYNLHHSEIIMIKGLEVSKGARGNGYAKLLIQLAHSLAKQHNRKHVITDIAFENLDSLGAFVHSNYTVVDVFHPVDDVELAIVYINLDEAYNFSSEWELLDATDYEGMKEMLQQGYYVEKLERTEKGSVYTMKKSKVLSEQFNFNVEKAA